MRKLTTEEFIKKSKEVHGDKYDYSNIKYKNKDTDIIIICKIHGEFLQTPHNHTRGKQGCPKCVGRQLSTNEIITKFKEIHGDKFDYSKVMYTMMHNDVIIICKIHGEFMQTPSSHILGNRCKHCAIIMRANSQRMKKEEFIERSIKIHGDKYDYNLVEYNNSKTKVKIICKIHGLFEQTPMDHLRNHGCLKCVSNNHSKAQIEWLKYLTIKDGYIQHMLNDGEYCIPDSKYKVDGYNSKLNIVYEYHGDYWHGNPKCFPKEALNKTVKKTFGELYDTTLKKKKYIESLGFKYIECWEYDWELGKKAIIKLQRLWRSKH